MNADLNFFCETRFLYPEQKRADYSTGLEDKNKITIFENDILKCPDDYIEPVTDFGEGPKIPFNHLLKVVWIPEKAAFGVHAAGPDRFLMMRDKFVSFVEIFQELGREYLSRECEVVGNVWENPELLEQEYAIK